MSDSPRLALPLLDGAQAQKHVTVNTGLMKLDLLVDLALQSRTQTAPPESPAEGTAFLVPAGATGAWASFAGSLALRIAGAWSFVTPKTGQRAYVVDEGVSLLLAPGGWMIQRPPDLTRSPFGSALSAQVLEEELTLSGASVTSTIKIPNRAIVMAVASRTSQGITGATSYDCGIAGDTAKFGSTLGIAVGSANVGVIGPTAFYADTALLVTARGASFTAGKVRLSLHYLAITAATG